MFVINILQGTLGFVQIICNGALLYDGEFDCKVVGSGKFIYPQGTIVLVVL